MAALSFNPKSKIQLVRRLARRSLDEGGSPARRDEGGNPKCGAGFTLIELLVTLTLLVLLLYMLATVFTAAQIAFTDTRRAVQVAQTGRAVLDTIRADLVGAQLVRFGDGRRLFFEGTDPDAGGTAPYDTIAFVTESYQSARATGAPVPPVPQLVKVTYYSDNVGVMKRVNWDGDFTSFMPVPVPDPAPADEAEAVAINVPGTMRILRLDFRYFGYDLTNGTAYPRVDGVWDSSRGRLPAAVEITLSMRWLDSRARWRDTLFTELVYLPASEGQ